MTNHSPGIGFGFSVVLAALSAVPGVAVSLFLAISLNPLVELFPANSGAHGIALGIAVMWGLVVAATVVVYAFGSVRRARRTVAGEGVETDWGRTSGALFRSPDRAPSGPSPIRFISAPNSNRNSRMRNTKPAPNSITGCAGWRR